jgi:hypothetical protein
MEYAGVIRWIEAKWKRLARNENPLETPLLQVPEIA